MTKQGDQGILIISWKNVPDEKLQHVISSFYKLNTDIIFGMNYYEVGRENADVVKGIPAFLERKTNDIQEKRGKQATLF
jgi:hypothetical protein